MKRASELPVYNFFVAPGQKPEKLFQWKKVDCKITDASGGVYFEMKGVKAPTEWSQHAVEIAASKYFRHQEKSLDVLIDRVVTAITKSGVKQKKYFKNSKQAKTFENELKYILLSQRAFFNSPVWFNCGLYPKPQVSACFIQSVTDSTESIFQLAKNEAMLFKYGSGSGTNFSKVRGRGEPLSGGGTSSGLISFLEVLDRGAGAIKSGGTTRRAAKMVCLDVDHPEIEDFVQWKMHEEKKALALIRAGYDSHYEGEAYRTVGGQNANNSVRVTNKFLEAVQKDKEWNLKSRVSGKAFKSIQAKQLWNQIAEAAWTCADPGLQFHDTIQKWHTCSNTDKINASNPCSEYMFLDDSACNLASLNLAAFLDIDGGFDLAAYMHTVRIVFIAQEILVSLAGYPTELIGKNSEDYRPLGLGFCGLGALLMRKAIPYDSQEARSWAGALSAILTGEAYRVSSQMAKLKKPFAGFKKNKTAMLKVLTQHQKELKNIEWQHLPRNFKDLAEHVWGDAIANGKKYGFRNAQASVMAPTGTIGLVMDSDTTGIEPEFSLVKLKKLAGGGELRIVSQSVPQALEKLKYSESEIEKIVSYIEKNGEIEKCPLIKKEHLSIFDCAVKNSNGERFLSADAHLKMMCAIQPFISGAISKTVNIPFESSKADVANIYMQAWKMGLKAIAIYRDGSKGSQPLNVEKKAPMDCPECGGNLILEGGCFRCENCGTTTGCAS